MFILFNMTFSLLAIAIENIIGSTVNPHLMESFSASITLPSLAVTVKKLHDMGISGIWILVS